MNRDSASAAAPNEAGEAIGKFSKDPSNVGSRFEGYTSPEASEKKILRNVFEPGDAWFRTGDLMRKDEKAFSISSIGSATRSVGKAKTLPPPRSPRRSAHFPESKHANVYGVAIPGTEGRAGMATLVAEAELDLAAFRAHLMRRLPHYARPLFLRIRTELEVTATFKYTKTALVRQGYDPAATTSAVYFNDPVRGAFIRLDQAMFQRIQAGQLQFRASTADHLGRTPDVA